MISNINAKPWANSSCREVQRWNARYACKLIQGYPVNLRLFFRFLLFLLFLCPHIHLDGRPFELRTVHSKRRRSIFGGLESAYNSAFWHDLCQNWLGSSVFFK